MGGRRLAGQAAGGRDCPTAGLGPTGDVWAAASQTLSGYCGSPAPLPGRGIARCATSTPPIPNAPMAGRCDCLLKKPTNKHPTPCTVVSGLKGAIPRPTVGSLNVPAALARSQRADSEAWDPAPSGSQAEEALCCFHLPSSYRRKGGTKCSYLISGLRTSGGAESAPVLILAMNTSSIPHRGKREVL